MIRARGEIEGADFSLDGGLLTYAGDARRVIVEPWRTAEVADIVCRRTWRELMPDEWSRFVGGDPPRRPAC